MEVRKIDQTAKAVLALDQGTTSSRAIVFGPDGSVLGRAQEAFPQHYPEPGWVEHDPEDIWGTQIRAGRAALAEADLEPAQLAAVGIANQRETVLLWDAKTGECLGNAIVWQCRRTASRCDELKDAGLEPAIQARTGLRIDPYFSATKIEWLLANRPGAGDLLSEGRLRAGTIDSFLVWRLTGGRHHVTDVSNASRTILLDLHSLDWAEDLLELFGVPRTILPRVCPSSALVGMTDPAWLGAAVPIAGIAGDQQAALFGQGALREGECKSTYGTGCFLLLNTGSRPVPPRLGLLSTVAWKRNPRSRTGGEAELPQQEDMPPEAYLAREAGPADKAGGAEAEHNDADGVVYALEGSVFMAGGAVQWLRDAMGIIDSAAEIGPLAARAGDNGGVYFVPALTGLGTPYWDPYARGLLIGLTRGTRPEHLARATEEAICFQTRAVLEAMRETADVQVSTLRVDGGAVADDTLLQLLADILGLPVARPRVVETTALGAAALAGLATGFWSVADVLRLAGTDQVFQPHMRADEREHLYQEWQRALQRALSWAQET